MVTLTLHAFVYNLRLCPLSSLFVLSAAVCGATAKKHARHFNATRPRPHLRICSFSALFGLSSFAAVCASPQRKKHARPGYINASRLRLLFAFGAVRVELVRGRLRVATAATLTLHECVWQLSPLRVASLCRRSTLGPAPGDRPCSSVMRACGPLDLALAAVSRGSPWRFFKPLAWVQSIFQLCASSALAFCGY